MSSTERRPALPHRLVVPAVEPDDAGLVLTIEHLEWDADQEFWALTAANGHRYALPAALEEWARQLDAGIRGGLVSMPVLAAFSQRPAGMAVRILSTAQSL